MHEAWIIKRLLWKKKFSVNHVHIFKDKKIYNKDIKMSLLIVMNNQSEYSCDLYEAKTAARNEILLHLRLKNFWILQFTDLVNLR